MTKTYVLLVLLSLAAAGCAESESNKAPANAAEAAADAAVEANAGAEDATAAATAGDPEKGKRLYIYCQACHSINSGGMNKVGPNLYGVYGRAAAQAEGFVYSESLTSSGLTWDAGTLDAWVRRPSELVPGTTMVFAGIQDAGQRADLIAYIKAASTE